MKSKAESELNFLDGFSIIPLTSVSSTVVDVLPPSHALKAMITTAMKSIKGLRLIMSFKNKIFGCLPGFKYDLNLT